MSNWKLAKSLVKLRDQINAAYPKRSKKSDGSIGDQAHAARVSDHNPNAKGVVTAIDVTHDPANGVNGLALAEALKYDPRIKYLIFAGRIWKARTGLWEDYHGANSHHHHLHISVDAAAKNYDNAADWDLGITPKAESKPADVDKGVTASDKPADEVAGTPPPAPASEIKASQPSLFTRLGSLSVPAGVMAILSAVGKFFMALPPWAWVTIVIASMVIGYLIWREAKRQAHERTLKVMDAAADRDKNNLRLI